MFVSDIQVRKTGLVRRFPAILTLAVCALIWAAPPVQADPPPWAPAHGYRAKDKKHKHEHAVYVAPFGIDLGRCNRDLLGAVLGAGAGAAIGSTIGDGDERTVAIIGGTIIGAIVGGSIGRAMDEVDQNCVGQVLEHAPDGRTVIWADPDGGPRYRVTPVRTYQDEGGRYCRDYTTSAVINGAEREIHGTACRLSDGSWRLVS